MYMKTNIPVIAGILAEPWIWFPYIFCSLYLLVAIYQPPNQRLSLFFLCVCLTSFSSWQFCLQ